jgi:hypothetical protein
MDVGSQREGRRVVPEPMLDLYGVAAFREQHRGAGMAEGVDPRRGFGLMAYEGSRFGNHADGTEL